MLKNDADYRTLVAERFPIVCGTCLFHAVEGNEEDYTSVCHRYPTPAPIAEAYRHWCGEWEPREQR